MRAILFFVRLLLGFPQPKITREQAIEIAKMEFIQRGWEYRQLAASEGLTTFSVRMWRGYRPCPIVVVDNQDGKVLRIITPKR